MKYSFERISPQFYKHIQSLYLDCFDLKKSSSFIQKKYNTLNFKNKDIGYIATDINHQPAAYYGVFPISVIYKRQKINAAQSGDTMTHPNHRKQGLFTKLALKTYELAQRKSIEFIFGFPNEHSLPGFEKKLNWKFYGYMRQFVFKSSLLPVAELNSKIRIFNAYYKKFCEHQLREIITPINSDNIKEFRNSNIEFGISRDISFFEYKSHSNPYLLKINGFTIYIKIDDHLRIGDVAYFEIEQTSNFINTIKTIGKLIRASKTILAVSENHWLNKHLSSFKKSEKTLPIGFLNLNSNYPLEKMCFTGADYDTF